MIQFDPATHTYSVNGVGMPFVTGILTSCGLITGRRFMSQADSDRGTAVHKITEFYDKGTLDETTVDPRLVGYFNAYKRFLAEHNPVWGAIEKRVFSPLGYCGSIDRIGTIGNRLTVLDIKTGVPCKWHGLQLAGYAITTISEQIEFAEIDRVSLHLADDGEYKMIHHGDPADMQYFLACLSVAQLKKRWDIKNDE